MKMTPPLLRRILNFYPPYIGAGVKIDYLSDDWREMQVSMRVRWYNRNYFGTHFGGSLYSMVDPHICLMLTQILGKDYLVWDKAADIDFVKATNKPVIARFHITESQIEEIKANTASGDKYLPEYEVDIIDEEKNLIAKVNKTLYVRKKKDRR
ncbi:DUF4442 domain-containing protein [Paraneptunicella aestuarii]|uniref:DUF4442 domain-containing protein n=1 Tax=Paraneptunicella aestuarii TaxID=2831148 RepID=UPI001E5D6DF9|nr:DUF4442 domain-containing protein [Paraneptunicella aestuarii]UAA39029.1 DUF4442 domain-containing protein [Paraneptunicella aestuarii]